MKELDGANNELAAAYAAALQGLQTERAATDPTTEPGSHDALMAAETELQKARAAWMEYRDAFCGAVALSYTTGSGAGDAQFRCQIELTRTQATLVREWRR